ncbi:MAG: 5-formyltetrahydrofolate cyclo-ligase [Treponema sp.]|nr:5-formyltetrahydrofolate cyclo-ligase [Treponema sp.]
MEQPELIELKKSLRMEMRTRIRSFCADIQNAEAASAAAVSAFLASDLYRNAETIFTFVSTDQEVNTRRLIAKAVTDGKKTAVPRIISNTNEMDFYYLVGNRIIGNQLVSGAYGILEPDECAEAVAVQKFPAKTVIVVPGLAFSKDGCRLGRGRGFYDRYIGHVKSAGKNQPAALVGLCFDCQIVETVPHDDLDINVSHIASESGLSATLPHP